MYTEVELRKIYFDAFSEEISDDLIDLPYGDEYTDAIPFEIDDDVSSALPVRLHWVVVADEVLEV